MFLEKNVFLECSQILLKGADSGFIKRMDDRIYKDVTYGELAKDVLGDINFNFNMSARMT